MIKIDREYVDKYLRGKITSQSITDGKSLRKYRTLNGVLIIETKSRGGDMQKKYIKMYNKHFLGKNVSLQILNNDTHYITLVKYGKKN